MEKVHTVIKMNTKLRQKVKPNFEKDFSQVNELHRRHRDIKLASTIREETI